MQKVLHETCERYVVRRLSEGWRIVSQVGFKVILRSPEGIIRPVDLRNDTLTLRPNAAGSATNIAQQWPNATYHWDKVDEESADEDSTYVYFVTFDTGDDDYDLYNLPSHTTESGTINFVKVYIRCKRVYSASGHYASTKIQTVETEYEGSANGLDTSYANYSTQYNTNPHGGAWTWAQIDALQIGVRLWAGDPGEGGIVSAYCTQVYVEVDYTAIVIPSVTTQAATSVEATTATGNGTITNAGGENCDQRGMEWGTSPGNYPNSQVDTGSYPAGAFTKGMTGLPTGTTIYCRAKAHNSADWGYGGEVNFLTKPAAPTNVQASDGVYSDKVVITWTKPTGATGYQVYRDGTPLGWLGDVATYDDTGAGAPSITPGNSVASDGTSTAQVALSLSGTGTNNGTTHTYVVRARNAGGESADSGSNTGYRAPGALTYQWQRSADDSNADYSDIAGATGATYNDTAAPAPTITHGSITASDGSSIAQVDLANTGASANIGAGRYYRCILNAAGCAQQISAVDRGYRSVGTLTYQWYRSAGDNDADYSAISGATSSTYGDTGAPAPTITPGAAAASDGTSSVYVALSLSGQSANVGAGRYYKCYHTATGATPDYTGVDRGYRGVGALTYQWQRSVADSDANYSNISGATTASYNDTAAPANGEGRYFRCVEDATGATQQNSSSNRGYRWMGEKTAHMAAKTVAAGVL